MTPQELLRGPLHDVHERLGARFVAFSGFEMPVLYSGIQEEHRRVREEVGLFDVSHMSNLRIEGPAAAELLSLVSVAQADALKVGRAVYTVLPDDNGHIIDDTIFYRTGEESFHLVPNAGMNERVGEWLQKHAERLEDEVVVRDVSRSTCIFALQGPNAPAVLEAAGLAVPDTPRFRVHEVDLDGGQALVATTGYTGETGYELIVHEQKGPELYERLLAAGTEHGIVPCGLGARDTLRLEMGYCLAGHEFKGGRTPLEAGLGWAVKWDHEFIGRDALLAQKEEGQHDRLVGLEMTGRGIPREDHPVKDPDDGRIGEVTSGTMSPTLKKAIGLAYVGADHAAPDTEVAVEIRGKPVAARVVRPPFLKK